VGASESEFFQALKKHLEQQIGRQAQDIGLRVFDYTDRCGIVRCMQQYRGRVLTLLGTMHEAGGRPVRITTQRVSGTLRSLR
jgi:RNase P/RNase MRP subunit POP5